jgi:hypothetical protein
LALRLVCRHRRRWERVRRYRRDVAPRQREKRAKIELIDDKGSLDAWARLHQLQRCASPTARVFLLETNLAKRNVFARPSDSAHHFAFT